MNISNPNTYQKLALALSLLVGVLVSYHVLTDKKEAEEDSSEEKSLIFNDKVETVNNQFVTEHVSREDKLNNLYESHESRTEEESIRSLNEYKDRVEEESARRKAIELQKKREEERERKEQEKMRREQTKKEQPVLASRGEVKQGGRVLTVNATHYSSKCTGCTGVTATGVNVRSTIYHQGMRVIAVDPNVIPLHSIVQITTPTSSFTAIAEDVGGAIKGNRIDILVETTEKAYQIGRFDVTVKILREGK